MMASYKPAVVNLFKNIFLENKYAGDLEWSLRPLNLMTSNDSYRQPISLKDLKEEFFKMILLQLSQKTGTSAADRTATDVADIKSKVEEISCLHSKMLIRVLGFVISKLLKVFFSSIQVNEKQLSKVKEIMKTAPVVFLPSHRSYCDFIVMAYICYFHDIEVPCVAAAIEFNNMQFVGKMIKLCKAFYIRRKFNENTTYKFIFQQYLQFLIKNINYPVEFFIEGTRSRSGKALTPKLGLLKVIMETYCQGEVPDIVIVPINISYDRILEDSLFAHEVLGFPKLHESTGGLIKALRSLKTNGNIFVNFDDPIFLRSHLHPFMTVSNNLTLNDSLSNPLKKMGHFIVRRQQEMQVITLTNLLCLFLHERYVLRRTMSMKKSELSKNILIFIELLTKFGVLVSCSDVTIESIDETVATHCSFLAMSEDEIQLDCSNAISNIDKKGWITDGVLQQAVPVLTLQLYINPLMFILGMPAIILLTLNTSLGGISIESCRQEYLFIRKFFLFEFVLEEGMEEEEFDKALSFLTSADLVSIDGSQVEANRDALFYPLLTSLLCPFLNAYHCISVQFLKEPLMNTDVKELLKSLQSLIEMRFFSNYPCKHLASFSTDILKNGLDSLVAIDVLERITLKENGSCVLHIKNMNYLKTIENKLGVILRCVDELKEANFNEVILPSKL